MSGTAVLLVVATSAYLGFQATIRMVVYPQFAAVPRDAFAAYEARHQHLVTLVVGPLFVLDAVACLIAFAAGPRGPAALAGAGLAAVLVLTAFAAVPAHRALSGGFDPRVHARLLRVDTMRVLAAAVSLAGAVWFAVA